jgi:N-hydroxyarylamine O-acetyltransferase
MKATDVRRYLDRFAATAVTPDLATLRDLQLRHLIGVPFENLSIHLGEPVRLAQPQLLDKIVSRRRGGFCYELNTLFAGLLRALGYRVTMLSAAVFNGKDPGRPFDHLTLRVDLDEPWLVDVGFGAFAHYPLRLDSRSPQTDPAGRFEIREAAHGDLIVAANGAPQYLLETRPRELADFGPTCWYHQTSPASHFTRSPTCSRLTESGGRITLSGRKLVRTDNGERSEEHLGTAEAVLAAYRQYFGFTLDRLPADPRETAG